MIWSTYFIKMADLVASKSRDPSTKVGAVVVGPDNEVLSTGYNGFARGIKDFEHAPVGDNALGEWESKNRWDRPIKYMFVEHAERNAIYNAARIGVSLKGATMYLNFEPCPCHECAKAIIQAGIRCVVGPSRPFTGKGAQWEESLHVAKVMLAEAGVETEKVAFDVGKNSGA